MPDNKDDLAEQHRQARAAVLAGVCRECGGVECGTPRVPVCCGDCTH